MTTANDFRGIYDYNWRVLRDFCEALSKLPRRRSLRIERPRTIR